MICLTRVIDLESERKIHEEFESLNFDTVLLKGTLIKVSSHNLTVSLIVLAFVTFAKFFNTRKKVGK